MFWGEPPRSSYDVNFTLFGIPVRIHPLFWVVAIFLGSRSPDLFSLLAWTAAVLVGILIHEFGHALTMRAYGFSPWITLHGLGGLTSYQPAGFYRSAGYGSLGQIAITAAGPGAGFLSAAVLGVLLGATGYEVAVGHLWGFIPCPLVIEQVGSAFLTEFLNDLLFISVVWGVINLLPVYPLDGGQIAREVFLKFTPHDGIRLSLILSIVVAAGFALVALARWGDFFLAIFFGYLAFSSYATLQSYTGRGPF